MLAYKFNSSNFLTDLAEGDPVVWCIVVAIVFFTGLQAYQQRSSFQTSGTAEEEA